MAHMIEYRRTGFRDFSVQIPDTCFDFEPSMSEHFMRSLTVYERDPSDRRYRMTVDLDHDRDSSQLA